MLIILLTSAAFWILVMCTISAIFWCIEAVPLVKAMKRLEKPKQSRNPITIVCDNLKFISGFITALFISWPLILDIFFTTWLTGALGLTASTWGAVGGLAISNVISIFLLIISHSPKSQNKR